MNRCSKCECKRLIYDTCDNCEGEKVVDDEHCHMCDEDGDVLVTCDRCGGDGFEPDEDVPHEGHGYNGSDTK